MSYDHCQSADLDLHSKSQVHLKLDYFLTCNTSQTISLSGVGFFAVYADFRGTGIEIRG